MSLRVQLALAFFVLAVLPLAGLSLYSYNASIRAFRQAVEAESGLLAEEMSSRMDSFRTDLDHRMERLSRFPFARLMDDQSRGSEESEPLTTRLMIEMGQSAGVVDALEYIPAPPPPPGAAGTHPAPVPPPQPPDRSTRGDRIARAPASSAEAAQRLKLAQQRMVLKLHSEEVRQLSEELGRQVAGASAVVLDQLSKLPKFQIIMEEVRKSVDQAREIEQRRKAAVEVAAGQPMVLGREFGTVVSRDGEAVGTIKAHVSAPMVFQRILIESQKRPGDIPFVVDGEGKTHTRTPDEGKELEALDLMPASKGVSSQTREAERRNWVVATRKDQDSSLTFGVARPIGDSLEEIRRTAVRNLGWGLAMVGLALVGILPISGRMTRNLDNLASGAEKLAEGDLSVRVPVRSKDEFGRLARTFNRMAADISEHQKSLLERERLRKELEMCRKIQEELLPRHPLAAGFAEARGVSIPASEVGGDFFNYFSLPGGEVAILVGDVSGKGIAAALLMANLQATLRAKLSQVSDLAELAAQLDMEMEASTPPEVYVTLFMGILERRGSELRYVNAGHNAQFALHASDGSVDKLESTGRPVGLLPGGGYAERRIPLNPGDSLFLYTDGLVEAENKAGEQFGMERIESILKEEGDQGIDSILVRIEKEVRQHRGAREPADDATMLALRIGDVRV